MLQLEKHFVYYKTLPHTNVQLIPLMTYCVGQRTCYYFSNDVTVTQSVKDSSHLVNLGMCPILQVRPSTSPHIPNTFRVCPNSLYIYY